MVGYQNCLIARFGVFSLCSFVFLLLFVRCMCHHHIKFDRVDEYVNTTQYICRLVERDENKANTKKKVFLMSYVYLHIIYGLQYLKRLLLFFFIICYFHSFWLVKMYSENTFFDSFSRATSTLVYLLLKFEYLFDLLRKNGYISYVRLSISLNIAILCS